MKILHQIVMTCRCTVLVQDLLYFMTYVTWIILYVCCKTCTHKMATKKCLFSQWLCSILTSHSMAFPSDKTAPWQKVTIITNMKQIHSTSCTILLPLHRDSSYVLVCYWIKACVTLCVGKIWYDDYNSMKW